MKSLTELKSILAKEMPFLKGRYGVMDIQIFGSYARGQAKEDSDIDLIVQLEENRTLLDLGGIQYYLQSLLDKRIDIVELESIKPAARVEIEKDLVAL